MPGEGYIPGGIASLGIGWGIASPTGLFLFDGNVRKLRNVRKFINVENVRNVKNVRKLQNVDSGRSRRAVHDFILAVLRRAATSMCMTECVIF